MDTTPERRKRGASPNADGMVKSHTTSNERRRGGDDSILRRRRYDDRDEQSDVVYFLYGDMKEHDRDKDAYVETLKNELAKIDASCIQARRLVDAEIARVRDGKAYPQDHINLHRDRLIKLCAKIAVPVHEYPQVSFLGRIFGPGGENLKNLCRQTRAKIGLFGAGCTKDSEKEKDMLRRNDPQYDHLNEGLHLYVETIGFPAEAYARIAHVMNEARKFMDPYYPGIPNMKPEEIKRLILEQRRVSGLYKSNSRPDGTPANETTPPAPEAASRSFASHEMHGDGSVGTHGDNTAGFALQNNNTAPVTTIAASSHMPPRNAMNFARPNAPPVVGNAAQGNNKSSVDYSQAPLSGSVNSSSMAGKPPDNNQGQPMRRLSPSPMQQQQSFYHGQSSASTAAVSNYGMPPSSNTNAPYLQQQPFMPPTSVVGGGGPGNGSMMLHRHHQHMPQNNGAPPIMNPYGGPMVPQQHRPPEPLHQQQFPAHHGGSIPPGSNQPRSMRPPYMQYKQ